MGGGYYLVDGTNLLYRAYHALQALHTAKGLPTHAAYGFLSMVFRVLKEQAPEVLAVVFDPPGPTRKHELYADYKSNREGVPDDLRVQIPYVHRALEALGIRMLMMEGVEADDLLGALATRLADRGEQVVVVTGDKDFCQLVRPNLRLLDTMRDKLTGPEEVVERFEVPAERIVDLLSLAGDPIDNLPGVPGIGRKTAAQLLQKYGSLEAVVAHASEVKGKKGEALRQHARRVLANRALVTIETDLEIEVGLESLRAGSMDRAALASLLRELEFHRFLRELDLEGYESELVQVRAEPVGVPAEWVSVSRAGEVWAMATGAGDRAAGRWEEIPTEWKQKLSDPRVPLVGHGLKELRIELARLGVRLEGIHLDTEVAAYLLRPGRRSYPVDEMCRDRGLAPQPGSEVPDPACRSAMQYLRLARCLESELEEAGLLRLYQEVENPLVPVLADMEIWGVKVDAVLLGGLSREYEERLGALERRIFESAGETFNPQSPRQLAHVLFEKLKLPSGKKTASGYSTDASVLEELALVHEVPRLLLEHRSLAKLKSSFIDALPALVDERTGRIHAQFHQTVTATGRLSSSNPNLQNIPIRGEEGRRIREAFVAEGGKRLLSADYSQIELRVLAHLSGDEDLVEVFRTGRDVHAETASRIFGVSLDAVDTRMRREAKIVNFGILYGMGPFGLARQLGISREAARKMIDAYFRQFARVRIYLDGLVEKARQTGWSAETLFGRRRPIPEIASRNRAQREFGERMALNTPIQGTAADLIKKAMVRARDGIRAAGMEAHLILQVHDELVFETAEGECEEAAEVVREAMEGAATLSVPLVAQVCSGRNWFEAH